MHFAKAYTTTAATTTNTAATNNFHPATWSTAVMGQTTGCSICIRGHENILPLVMPTANVIVANATNIIVATTTVWMICDEIFICLQLVYHCTKLCQFPVRQTLITNIVKYPTNIEYRHHILIRPTCCVRQVRSPLWGRY